MLVPQEQAERLVDLVLTLVKKVAIKAHEYIGNHDRIRGYRKYPVLSNTFSKDDPEFDEINKSVPFLIYDIPRYELKDYPEDSIQYGAIFNGYGNDRINVADIDGFNVLCQFVVGSDELTRAFWGDNANTDSEFRIKIMITEIVERYLFARKQQKMYPPI